MASQATGTTESSTPPVLVQVAKVESITLYPAIDLVGTIIAVPEKTAVVSPQQGGWVQKLDVVEGQSVKAGDVLVEVDPRAAQVAVQRAGAVVAEKQAALARLKSGYLPQEIAAARKDAQRAEATVEALGNELAALKNLLDRAEISSVVYENKAKGFEAAGAAAAAATQRLKLLEAGTRPEMIAEAQALLDAAQADLKQAKLTLEWCTITSPTDGVVTQLVARRGQFFDRAVPLATIMDLSTVFAQLSIPSAEFAKVKIGTPVEVTLKSLAGKVFRGTIARISGQADPLTGNVVVNAMVPNEERLLRPGFICQAQVSLPAIRNALAVPVAAVADNSGTAVVTLIRDGKAYETNVETGIETREFVQVLKGLTEGDLVATAGGYGLPAGTLVRVRGGK